MSPVFNHCPKDKMIIKWYEYDASKLVVTQDSTVVAEETSVEPVASTEAAPESASTNPDMAAEVARIMASFASAKQDAVDMLFA